jgi:hypothetical protein
VSACVCVHVCVCVYVRVCVCAVSNCGGIDIDAWNCMYVGVCMYVCMYVYVRHKIIKLIHLI